MTSIVTLDGDHLDALLVQHYGVDVAPSALAAVLAANVGLAAYGPVLPSGVRIVLPDLTPVTPTLQLWE